MKPTPTKMDIVTEVINMTCNELIQHLRRSFKNETANLSNSPQLGDFTTRPNYLWADIYETQDLSGDTFASCLSDELLEQAGSSNSQCILIIVLCVAIVIYQVFSVPRVTDKLNLCHKQDSKVMAEVLKHTKLSEMAFVTCLAGSV